MTLRDSLTEAINLSYSRECQTKRSILMASLRMKSSMPAGRKSKVKRRINIWVVRDDQITLKSILRNFQIDSKEYFFDFK